MSGWQIVPKREKIWWRKCTSDEKIRWQMGHLMKGDGGKKVGGEWVSGEKIGGEKNRWRTGLWRKLQHRINQQSYLPQLWGWPASLLNWIGSQLENMTNISLGISI